MSHNIKLDSHCSLSPNNLKFWIVSILPLLQLLGDAYDFYEFYYVVG